MKVTKITAQIKTKGRYSIFIDDVYSFSLSEHGLINSGIRVGKDFSRSEVENLKDESKADKLYNKSLGLLARRPRSRWELEEYLKRNSDDASQNEKILNALSNNGYVDDLDFARRWVDNRRLLKATSVRRLRLELMQKRIPELIIDQVLSEDQTDEQDVLKELIRKKRSQTRYQDNLKLMQYLTRQGFGYQDIKQAITEEESSE